MLLRGHVSVGITALAAVVLIDLIVPVIDRFIKQSPFGGSITLQKEETKK